MMEKKALEENWDGEPVNDNDLDNAAYEKAGEAFMESVNTLEDLGFKVTNDYFINCYERAGE